MLAIAVKGRNGDVDVEDDDEADVADITVLAIAAIVDVITAEGAPNRVVVFAMTFAAVLVAAEEAAAVAPDAAVLSIVAADAPAAVTLNGIEAPVGR